MPAELQVRRRAKRSDDTREQILRSAAELLATYGYTATSLDQVAAHAGLTKGTIYYHFDSKEALYWAVVEPKADRAPERVRTLLEEDIAPLRALRRHVRAALRAAQNPRARYMYYKELLPLDEEMLAKARERDREYEQLVAQLIERAQKSGDVIAGNPRIMALILVSAISRTARWYNPEGEVGLDEFVDTFYRMVLQGMIVRPEAQVQA